MSRSLPRSFNSLVRAAAVLWFVAGLGALALAASVGPEWGTLYAVMTVMSAVAGATTLFAALRLVELTGSTRAMRLLVAALVSSALVATAFVNWAYPVWTALWTIGVIMAGWRTASGWLGGRTALMTTALAWPIGFGAFAALDRLAFGPIDGYGDYPWAGGTGLAVWTVVYGVGLLMLASAQSRDASAKVLAVAVP